MKKLIGGVLVAVLVAVGWFGWRGLMGREPKMVLPEFEALPPGPRAPHTAALGVSVGRTLFPELEAFVAARKMTCRDTSARALMKVMREEKKKAREEKLAKGEEVDAVSSASSKKGSRMEQSPQIRYSCEDTPGEQLGDHPRPTSNGRALYVFDSPDHPVRHASYRRMHADVARALDDAKSTLEALTAAYGPPHTSRAPLPELQPGDTFPAYEPLKFEWKWADLSVAMTVIGYGKRGIDVYEAVEVPWPVRPDAPTLPAAVAER